MEEICLQDEKGQDICFTGERVAHISDRPEGMDKVAWLECRIFKTEGGNFVCEEIKHAQPSMVLNRRVKVCEDEALVMNFFGFSDLAKKLHEQAGIDHVRRVA